MVSGLINGSILCIFVYLVYIEKQTKTHNIKNFEQTTFTSGRTVSNK